MIPRFTLNPYHAVLERKIRAGFASLNTGDYRPVAALLAPDVRYCFAGSHALGGERVSKPAVARWFERLLRLLPSTFRVTSVLIGGPPWNTDVVVEFEDTVRPAFGPAYVNKGVQKVTVAWGKAVRVHTYVDTAKIEAALRILAAHGIAEAAAPPIEG